MPWKLIITGLIGVATGVGAAVAVMRDIPKRLEENEKLTWHHDDRIAALEARLTLLEESPKGMAEVDLIRPARPSWECGARPCTTPRASLAGTLSF